MFAEKGIVFKVVSNNISHASSYEDIGFKKGDKFVAFIREYPHAILKSYKPDPPKLLPNPLPCHFSLLAYVKHHNTPLALPAFSFWYFINSRTQKRTFPQRGHFKYFFSTIHANRDQFFLDKSPNHALDIAGRSISLIF